MSEKKECQNCRYASPSLLGWIFCKHPKRMLTHEAAFARGLVPEGGFPQSLNHTCYLWEKTFSKHRIEMVITDFIDATPEDFIERVKQCLELSGYKVEIGGWN